MTRKIVLCLSFIFVMHVATACTTHHEYPDEVPINEIEVTTSKTDESSILYTTESVTTTEMTETTTSAPDSSEIPAVTDVTDTMTYLGNFAATYYSGNTVPCYGGSGRMLISSYEKDDWYKGSVASRYIYEHYGYYLNEKTMIYCEFPEFQRLNGWYSVDDCNSDSGIFDFYYADYDTCPWQNDGVTKVEVWI